MIKDARYIQKMVSRLGKDFMKLSRAESKRQRDVFQIAAMKHELRLLKVQLESMTQFKKLLLGA